MKERKIERKEEGSEQAKMRTESGQMTLRWKEGKWRPHSQTNKQTRPFWFLL